MNNEEFLNTIKNAFSTYAKTSPQSNKKLEILHRDIAEDLDSKISDFYKVHSIGFGDKKEFKIPGAFYDKKADITVTHDDKAILGIAVKCIMSNYSQNSNNYFENMIGETVNIKEKNTPYYQIIILPEYLPYFSDGGAIKKIEEITENNLEKYIKLSKNRSSKKSYCPNKILLYFIDLEHLPKTLNSRNDYKEYLTGNDFSIACSKTKIKFGSKIIYNDYDKFIKEIKDYLDKFQIH